ncbi:TPA: ABC transporter permease, partial [Clostridioides difficile]|nr:ABC transporter permease [Clostridioides difficile]HCQ5621216.1 ABC transporter permease [Clostridioides difficile]
MNFFGLARRSVFRKPVKSILLLLIVFAISTLLLAGVASKNASIEVQDKTRQAIGAGFLLEKNAEYRTKRISELSEKIGEKDGELEGYHQEKVVVNGAEGWRGWTTNEFETLDIKDIEKLAKTNGIADYNITTAITAVNPVNFQRIEDKDVDQSVDVGGVSLIGNRDMKLDRNVLSGNLHIKEGRMITPEDKDMCVISEELA